MEYGKKEGINVIKGNSMKQGNERKKERELIKTDKIIIK